MKPYVMQYSEQVKILPLIPTESTLKTFSIESTDTDVMSLRDVTMQTNTHESADNDLFLKDGSENRGILPSVHVVTSEFNVKGIFMSTLERKIIEQSDTDQLALYTEATIITRTLENSDTDDMNLMDVSTFTESIEPVDAGLELTALDTSQLTEAIEGSDPDNLFLN
ncbi:hypothetical protein [Shewanella baltica]|uniref:hypothetical protein n=1 Tax=Shewanella baltica TaxID=62322 RepID=UPI00217D03AE|nr:hypothetical protein [Shewanella baltica]MCS6096964.1 hypothetical protein [Shewanella baltica]MCS6228072.1 hypothetical protein [Shewanella baltica]